MLVCFDEACELAFFRACLSVLTKELAAPGRDGRCVQHSSWCLLVCSDEASELAPAQDAAMGACLSVLTSDRQPSGAGNVAMGANNVAVGEKRFVPL